MSRIEAEVDRLAEQMQAEDAGRFLRSHLGAQSAMLRTLAALCHHVARAARAMHDKDAGQSEHFLCAAVQAVDEGLDNWQGKYEGRFRRWPARQLRVGLESKKDLISQRLQARAEAAKPEQA